jgi:exonuclease SbcC
MKMTYIKIRGAIGFKKGLGVDEIEFDLSDKTGLVALSGQNGKGKTTLLELMSPYRTFASRKGSFRHHFFLRDSFIERRFEYGGHLYHTIVKIDSGSDRTEGFIVVDGESVVNGKVKEYDKFIIDLFGSQVLFYNSVFCAQGSENMSSMTAGKIKDLFVEFLRIERLEENRKISSAGVEFYEKKLNVIDGKIDVCNDQLTDLNGIDKKIEETDLMISDKKSLIDGIDNKIELAESSIKDLNSKIEKQSVNIERKTDFEIQLKKLVFYRDQKAIDLKLETQSFAGKKYKLDEEIEFIDSILTNKEKIFAASSRIITIEKNERYFSSCYGCAVDEQPVINNGIKFIDESRLSIFQNIKSLEDDLILDGLKTTLNYLELNKKGVFLKRHALENKLNTEENNFAVMQATSDVVICKEKITLAIDPDCSSSICPAIKMVKDAQNELSKLEGIENDLKSDNDENIKAIRALIKICDAHIIDLDDRIAYCVMDERLMNDEINAKIKDFKEEDTSFINIKTLLSSDNFMNDEIKEFYQSKLSSIKTLIDELKILSSKKSQIEIAEEKKIYLDSESKRICDDFEAKKKDISEKCNELSKDILLTQELIFDIDENIETDIDEKIENKKNEKLILSRQRYDLIEALDELRACSAVFVNDIKKREGLICLIEDTKKIESMYQKELNEWDYLRLACSKTGLQALEIDGAAPLITSEANTLLEQAFGLDSQIKIITQDPETGKEVFWIKVIRDDGAEDDFGNLSGGQKVWIAKALSLGMTLVSKRKSGRDFRSLFADEEDGALDSEKAIEFIQLYRSMMTTGDFDTCFFISHNPDVVAMADYEINFGAL